MKETMLPVNTAGHFQTTRTVQVRDVTVSVTEIGIERNHETHWVKSSNGIGLTGDACLPWVQRTRQQDGCDRKK